MKNKVTIYTDGACSGNPGPGGWAAILRYGDHGKELSGGDRATTNNKMELTAAIKALEALKRPCGVVLYSDSSYLINAFRQNWVGKWQKNGWRAKGGHAVKNQDLWQQLIALMAEHDVQLRKVKGHSGDEYNERCDELAKAAVPAG